MTTVETAVRAMSKAERVSYLKEHGWYRLSAAGAQMWFSPGWERINPRVVDPNPDDRTFYSLAAAIRKALA